MVLVEKWPFFQVPFWRQYRSGKRLYDILKRKNAFLGYKIKNFKKSKNCHFSKGVNQWFWSKNGHFSNFFFFRQNRLGKCVLRYSGTKKLLSRRLKKRSSKSRKIAFFSKRVNQQFWSKNGHFSNFFFAGNIGQENDFYDILKRKNAFLGYKIKKFKKSKNAIFPKELTHGFGPKMVIFPTSFLWVKYGRKMSFTIFWN